MPGRNPLCTVAQATLCNMEHWETMGQQKLWELNAGAGYGVDALLGRWHSMRQVIHTAVHDGEHRASDPTRLYAVQGLLVQVSCCLTIKVITVTCCT